MPPRSGCSPCVGDAPSSAAPACASFVPKSPKSMGRMQRMMATAGYHGEWPAIAFVAVQLALPVVVFLTVRRHVRARHADDLRGPGRRDGYVLCRISGWGGRSSSAAREIRNGLPDAIDLLIVCIEAGSGIDQALAASPKN